MKILPVSLLVWEGYQQFILANKEKVPVDLNGQPVNANDPANWMSATEACGYSELLGYGVGFIFTKDDPFWFLDLDYCIVEDAWTPKAGRTTEISARSTGLHIFGIGQSPTHSSRNATSDIEFYTGGRLALLTGNEAKGNVQTVSPHLEWLVDSYFPPKITEVWRDTLVPGRNGAENNEELIGEANQNG